MKHTDVSLSGKNESHGAESAEKRRDKRSILLEAVNVAFYNNGLLFRGSMVDLSAAGARLQLPAGMVEAVPDLSIGRKMEYYVITRRGRSKCRGAIQWITDCAHRLTWGISFVELSDEEEDPLQLTIDAVCHTEKKILVTHLVPARKTGNPMRG